MDKIKISWIEAVSILTVSQVFSTIAFSMESLNGLNAISGMVAFLVGIILNFIAIIPLFLVCKKFGYISILNLSYKKFGRASYIATILLFSLFICTCSSTVVVFKDFISTAVLDSSSSFIVTILLIGTSVYGAFLGIEALGRFANIIFVLLSISILIILVSILRDIEPMNFGRFDISNADKILKTALKGVFSNTGLLSALLLTPLVNKQHTRAFTIWNIASLVLVELIVFTVSGVLGDYALNKQYPYYSTTTVAELSIFKRLDIVYMCVWVFVAFIKTTYYLTLSKNLFDTFLRKSARKYSLLFCTGFVSIFSLISSIQPVVYTYMQSFISSGIGISIIVVLPLLLLLLGGKRCENF